MKTVIKKTVDLILLIPNAPFMFAIGLFIIFKMPIDQVLSDSDEELALKMQKHYPEWLEYFVAILFYSLIGYNCLTNAY